MSFGWRRRIDYCTTGEGNNRGTPGKDDGMPRTCHAVLFPIRRISLARSERYNAELGISTSSVDPRNT
jgi:hypothetical protein